MLPLEHDAPALREQPPAGEADTLQHRPSLSQTSHVRGAAGYPVGGLEHPRDRAGEVFSTYPPQFTEDGPTR